MPALPGFRDFYPADTAARQFVFARWREVARRYGFCEVDGPTLEPIDLYRKKSGGELVGQLFDFLDKGDRHVALRPEMTPTLARIIAARDRDFKKPLKWFSIANFFRYEKQQKGRLREFTQLNCDLVGDASTAADAEMIALVIDLMRSCGLTENDFVVRLNDRNAWFDFMEKELKPPMQEEGVPEEYYARFLLSIDKWERDDVATRRQKLKPFIFDYQTAEEMVEKIEAFYRRSPAELSPALGGIETDISARGLRRFVEFDPRIVRGLAYYTGVVFEVFDRARTSRALAGGGRYDKLIGLLSDGAVAHPALGFAVGDVTLLDLLRALPHTAALLEAGTRAASAPQVYGIVADETVRAHALASVQALREAGLRMDFSLAPAKVGKQFQAAENTGAPLAVIYGAEWPMVKIKFLASREETTVAQEQLADALRSALRPTETSER